MRPQPFDRSMAAKAQRPAEDFTVLGAGSLASVKAARSEDVAIMCPDAPIPAPGQDVFVLYAADGTPILVTDTRDAALAHAAGKELEAVSLD